MRRRLPAIVFALVSVVGFKGPDLQAACATPTPMYHGLDSFFYCDESTPISAFAYQQSDPVGVNTGAVEILCVAPGSSHCTGPASGLYGQITIETDWGYAGIVGCPLIPGGPHRVDIVVASGGIRNGSALIVSLSGANPDAGYLVEAAHPFDPDSGLALPISCRPTVVITSTSLGNVHLFFSHPPVFTDCDADSIGALYLDACHDAFVPTLWFGQVYTRVQPCSDPVSLRKELWSGTGVVPGPDGRATIVLDSSPPGACTLIGSTTVLNGVETGMITGFVVSDVDCTDNDGDGYITCGAGIPDCDDHNPAVHPDATEICNGIDDNCDGHADEGFDRDGDTVADCSDNCPNVANINQADRDGDSVGDVCDNCLEVPNPDQRDTDYDGFGDHCDNCPTIPNPDQNGCVCDNCEMPSVSISFSSPLSKGSGLVTWNSVRELDIIGFNVIEFTNQGERIQLNPVLIRCEECVTGLGHTYTYIIPKHKSGKNIFIEMLRLNGTIQTFGPATRI